MGKRTLAELFFAELQTDHFEDDVTGALLGPEKRPCRALVKAKQAGVYSGVAVVEALAEIFPTELEIRSGYREGTPFAVGDSLVTLEGDTRLCLAVERTLVNFLSHACGVATLTRRYVEATGNSHTKILATRKTLPGLRELQLAAVVAGGGFVHRRSLSDGILIKENHQMFLSGAQLIETARRQKSPLHKIEIEVQSVGQLDEILANPPDVIMLDNLGTEQLRAAIAKIDGRCEIEISGGVTLEKIGELSALGVNYISVGKLTHSAPLVDLSMDFIPQV